mmetsp:Transcript_2720/g.6136  ORF Transcript_2720/g.6136 Transcript_2720/m.6136 type:complete len:308 (-) Transcript_2720:1225-2148(-)
MLLLVLLVRGGHHGRGCWGRICGRVHGDARVVGRRRWSRLPVLLVRRRRRGWSGIIQWIIVVSGGRRCRFLGRRLGDGWRVLGVGVSGNCNSLLGRSLMHWCWGVARIIGAVVLHCLRLRSSLVVHHRCRSVAGIIAGIIVDSLRLDRRLLGLWSGRSWGSWHRRSSSCIITLIVRSLRCFAFLLGDWGLSHGGLGNGLLRCILMLLFLLRSLSVRIGVVISGLLLLDLVLCCDSLLFNFLARGLCLHGGLGFQGPVVDLHLGCGLLCQPSLRQLRLEMSLSRRSFHLGRCCGSLITSEGIQRILRR